MKLFIIFSVAVLMSRVASAQGWERQNYPTSSNLNAVVFVDTSNGWAVGDSGTIVHTTDGGGTWTTQVSPTVNPLNTVVFSDAENGWAAGGWCYLDEYYRCTGAVILHTTDGGGTWTEQVRDSTYSLFAMSFVDANHGWAVGGTIGGGNSIVILHTTDGGATWLPQECVWSFAPLTAVHFTDANHGLAVRRQHHWDSWPISISGWFGV